MSRVFLVAGARPNFMKIAPLFKRLSVEPEIDAQRSERRGMSYPRHVAEYQFTEYFDTEVLRKRPYLRKEWCIRVVEQPLRCEPQEHNRFRFWAEVPEFGGRVLRVVTLVDKLTIDNAFPDRGFKP